MEEVEVEVAVAQTQAAVVVEPLARPRRQPVLLVLCLRSEEMRPRVRSAKQGRVAWSSAPARSSLLRASDSPASRLIFSERS